VQPDESPFKLIIFDCDGVLIDSELLSTEVLIGLLAQVGVTIDENYVRKNFLGRSFPTVAQTIRDRFSVELPADFEAGYRRLLLARFETELNPTPGISELLAGLTVPKCVATSSSPPRVSRSLAITGLDRFFGANVFTASQVARGKPAPDLFLFAAESMGASPSRVLVVEDSWPGVEAARAAGMSVMFYGGGAHMRDHLQDFAHLVTSFDNWAELPHLLKTLSPDGHRH
jgi:HAD superfamily hydrolase (TIGR01509 family)